MRAKFYGFGVAIIALSALVGCSTITKGTDQNITVNTTPGGAKCDLERRGKIIGVVNSTPGTVVVDKTKHDILIKCNKEGFEEATYTNKSGWESGSGGAGIAMDVLLTIGISSAVDSISGADNKYEPVVSITLVPKK
jgi:hypothetical protein